MCAIDLSSTRNYYNKASFDLPLLSARCAHDNYPFENTIASCMFVCASATQNILFLFTCREC